MEYIVNLLQLIGGIILSIGNIPLIVKILKTHSVDDFSLTTLISVALGIFFMECYAIYNIVQGIAIMFFVTNTLALLIALIILILYFIFKRK